MGASWDNSVTFLWSEWSCFMSMIYILAFLQYVKTDVGPGYTKKIAKGTLIQVRIALLLLSGV